MKKSYKKLKKSEKNLKKSKKNQKKIWNSSKFEKSNAKSLKIAAKQLVFLHFWYMGIAKSNEKLAENFESSSKTASFHSFLNGWQQKMSEFTCFSVFFFRNLIQKNLQKKIKTLIYTTLLDLKLSRIVTNSH